MNKIFLVLFFLIFFVETKAEEKISCYDARNDKNIAWPEQKKICLKDFEEFIVKNDDSLDARSIASYVAKELAYGYGAYENNLKKRLEWAKIAAELNSLSHSGYGYYLMALAYEGGGRHGVEEDLDLAFEYLNKAREMGSINAVSKLAEWYRNNTNNILALNSREFNAEKRISLLGEYVLKVKKPYGSIYGELEQLFLLSGTIPYRETNEQAKDILIKLENKEIDCFKFKIENPKHDSICYSEVMYFFSNHLHGENKVKYLEKMAALNIYNTYCRLGDLFYKGEGLVQDFSKAKYYYQKGINKRLECFEPFANILVEEKNLVLAHVWYNIATALKYCYQCSEKRDELQKQLSTAEIKIAQRLANEWQQGENIEIGIIDKIKIYFNLL